MGAASKTVRRRGMRFAVVAALAALAGFTTLAISMSQRGDAAFPGANGRIAYGYGSGYGYSGGGIWSANADGSLPTQLTSGSNDGGPSYSADGGRIAFEREGGVAVMNSDGSGLTQLATSSSSNSSKTEWQEDYDDPNSEKVIPFVKIQTYASTWHFINSPSFSPDGSQLAVVKGVEDIVFTSICAVEEKEGQECIKYSDPGAYFNSDFECIGCMSQIVTISSASGAQTGELTPPSSDAYYWGPTYSADGKLAFAGSTKPAGSAIFLVNTPGAAPTQLTSGFSDSAPNFSPDGSRIVFTHGGGEIGLIGVGGGPVTLLPVPNPPGAFGGYVETPAFSPDGSRIVFGRVIHPSVGKSERGIYTIGADGSGLTKILDGGSSPNWQPIPLPPVPPPANPPKATPKKGKVKLNKRGEGVIGTIACGSSPCALKALSSKLKAGKEKCRAKAKMAKKLAPGKKTKIKAKVAGKCLEALKKAGKGKLVTKVRVTDAVSQKVLTLKSTLVPAKAKKKRHKK